MSCSSISVPVAPSRSRSLSISPSTIIVVLLITTLIATLLHPACATTTLIYTPLPTTSPTSSSLATTPTTTTTDVISDCTAKLYKSIRSRSAYFVGCECTHTPSSPFVNKPQSDSSPVRFFRFYSFRPVGPREDSAAHVSAMLRCYFDPSNKHLLQRACTPTSTRFQFHMTALSILHHCMHAAIVAVARRGEGDEAMTRAFRYGTEKCSARYVTQMEDMGRLEIDNAINCECEQRYGSERENNTYTVTVGSFGYLIRNAPGRNNSVVGMMTKEGKGNHEEQMMVKKCVTEALPDLTRMCRVQSRHFSLMVAQWFETCCKRARARFAGSDPTAKFVCKKIVPDDVTPLMS